MSSAETCRREGTDDKVTESSNDRNHDIGESVLDDEDDFDEGG